MLIANAKDLADNNELSGVEFKLGFTAARTVSVHRSSQPLEATRHRDIQTPEQHGRQGVLIDELARTVRLRRPSGVQDLRRGADWRMVKPPSGKRPVARIQALPNR